MDPVDDTSKLPPARTPTPSRVAAETRSRLEQAIEAQREQLLQAHGVLTCLYEVLLYAEGDDAICYAQAAHAAASLINKCAEELDSVRIRPLIDALNHSADYPMAEEWMDSRDRGNDQVKEPRVRYLR